MRSFGTDGLRRFKLPPDLHWGDKLSQAACDTHNVVLSNELFQHHVEFFTNDNGSETADFEYIDSLYSNKTKNHYNVHWMDKVVSIALQRGFGWPEGGPANDPNNRNW